MEGCEDSPRTSRSRDACDPAAYVIAITPCGGQHLAVSLAFHGGTNGVNIWRLNTDGSHPVQLSNGAYNNLPVCSADGK
jgi:hypothetical protein